MKLAQFLSSSIETLKQSGIDNPQLDARLLACHVLGIDRVQLLSQSQRDLSKDEIVSIENLLARRAQHESVARIIGRREFWGLNFGLNEATLEPRPDSEILVEVILSSYRRKPVSSVEEMTDKESARILDLGAGTGCLLLALLHEMADATGIGIDINPRAVQQASQNAALLRLDKRAVFRTGDWLAGVTEKFDIIISNPPYIPAAHIAALMPEVHAYDPILALDGGADGLAPYRHLIPQLADFLNPQGIMVFEVGIGQAQQVADLFRQSGFVSIQTHKDFGGVDRCLSVTIQSIDEAELNEN